MFKVYKPGEMNEMFARAFNSRDIDNLLSLYEEGAILKVPGNNSAFTGKTEIAAELHKLLQLPGTMVSVNNFCIEHDDVALLRADYVVHDGGTIVASGGTAEIVRRQADGCWLYIIDHAAGADVPRIEIKLE